MIEPFFMGRWQKQSFGALVKIGCARARALGPKKGCALASARAFGIFCASAPASVRAPARVRAR